jgi:hypothetical protein
MACGSLLSNISGTVFFSHLQAPFTLPHSATASLMPISNRTSPWQEAATPQLDGYRQWTFPTYPSDSPTSVRCGRDSLSWASKTSTLKVKAGDEFEFVATNAPTYVWDNKTEIQWDGCHEGRGGCIPEEYVRILLVSDYALMLVWFILYCACRGGTN